MFACKAAGKRRDPEEVRFVHVREVRRRPSACGQCAYFDTSARSSALSRFRAHSIEESAQHLFPYSPARPSIDRHAGDRTPDTPDPRSMTVRNSSRCPEAGMFPA